MRNIKPFRRAFTLTELLVVISIIAVLAGLLMPAIMTGQREGQKVDCMNNMKQFQIAIETYRTESMKYMPLWLSQMEDSLPDREIFKCPLDLSDGREGGRPDALSLSQFAECNDLTTYTAKDAGEMDPATRITQGYRNTKIDACSYMYEFVGEICTWYNDGDFPIKADLPGNNYSWRHVKLYSASSSMEDYSQKKWEGGTWVSDTSSPKVKVAQRVPIVRCYWHCELDGSGFEREDYEVMNLRWSGAVNKSPPDFWWIER